MSLGSNNKRSFIYSADSQNREVGSRKSQLVIFGGTIFAYDTPAVTKYCYFVARSSSKLVTWYITKRKAVVDHV